MAILSVERLPFVKGRNHLNPDQNRRSEQVVFPPSLLQKYHSKRVLYGPSLSDEQLEAIELGTVPEWQLDGAIKSPVLGVRRVVAHLKEFLNCIPSQRDF